MVTGGTTQITIDDAALTDILTKAVDSEVRRQATLDYAGRRTGPLGLLIEKLGQEYVQGKDLSALLGPIFAKVARPAIEDAMARAIKARTGQMLAEMVRTGEFDGHITRVIAEWQGNHETKNKA